MKDAIQYLEIDGQRVFAVVPIELWERMCVLAEDADDIRTVEAFRAKDDGVRIPAAVVDAELAGDHPVKAWRTYRRMTLEDLSVKAGVTKGYLSQIENGTRGGSRTVLGALARALDIDASLLIDTE